MPKPKGKHKFALWLHPETLAKVEKQYRDDDCRSRSEFIEKAILFYAGYLAADNCRDYIPNVIVSTVKGSLDSLENRMANLLFKMAVELSMMLHVTAAANAIDETSLTRLRGLCVEEVALAWRDPYGGRGAVPKRRSVGIGNDKSVRFNNRRRMTADGFQKKAR